MLGRSKEAKGRHWVEGMGHKGTMGGDRKEVMGRRQEGKCSGGKR